MKYIIFGAALFLMSCVHTQVMTIDSYAGIAPGSPIADVEATYGTPAEIRSKGTYQIYVYIERFQLGTSVVKQRRYYFTVDNGRIIDKHTTFDNPPPYAEIYNPDYMESID